MIGIFREEIYSPNRVSDDALILRATAEAVSRRGHEVRLLEAVDLATETPPEMALAMCESPRSLKVLEGWATLGCMVINSPRSVWNCHRYRTVALCRGTSIPLPKTVIMRTSADLNGHFDLDKGVWVKRGDVHSTDANDVQLHFNRSSIENNLAWFHSRGVGLAVLQEHVPGDPIKFYGVLPQRWFRWFYQNPEEVLEYPFSLDHVRKTAEMTAARLGLDVYGGDIVVNPDGVCLIDINNWPSFAACREEAAEQIASYVGCRSQHREPVGDDRPRGMQIQDTCARP